MPVISHIGKEQNSTNLYCRNEGFNTHVPLDIGEILPEKTMLLLGNPQCSVGHSWWHLDQIWTQRLLFHHHTPYNSEKADRKCLNFSWHSDIEKLPPAHSPPSSSP